MIEEFFDENGLIIGLITLLVIVFITGAAVLYHAGAFSSIVIRTCRPILREVKIAYKYAEGNYNDAGCMFTEAHSIFPNKHAIGIYYRNPKNLESADKKLQYIVGLVMSEHGEDIDSQDERFLVDKGYKFATLPSVDHAVQATFPFYNTVSIIFAVMRVYPALAEYIGSKKLCAHPYIEFYNDAKNEIVFIAPLEKQECFYVPEVNDDSCNETTDFDESCLDMDDESSIIHEGDCEENSLSNFSVGQSPVEELLPPLPKEKEPMPDTVKPSSVEEDSDQTDSSYEKIEADQA